MYIELFSWPPFDNKVSLKGGGGGGGGATLSAA